MAVINVTDIFNKAQQEGLKTIKQAQDANLAALTEFRAAARDFSEKPGTLPTLENLPTPVQFVEMSFAFAAQLLEIRKGYALKIAEMIVDTQKQAEATVKAATTTVSASNGTVPSPVKTAK